MIRPVLALACLCLPAAAQDIDCANAMAQAELNQCAYADWQAADAKLNAVYKQAMALVIDWDALLPTEERGAADALKAGQRAWIVFRDKACEAEGYAMKGGSAEPLVIYGCMREVTDARAAQLQAMLNGYGD
jgi:uncharacterized protein YecT (DUF1311 family)